MSSKLPPPASSGHVLPPEETRPEEDPPPYTPEAEPGLSVPGMSNIPPYLQQQISAPHTPPVQPARPNTRPPATTGRPNSQQRPPTTSHAYPGSGSNSYTYGQGRPGRPPNGQYHQPQQQYHQSQPQQRNPNLPFTYPPGYYCYKCDNTGIKRKNGLTCQDCYARFAHQSRNVQIVNPGPSMYNPFVPYMPQTTTYMPYPAGAPPPRFVRPGDPSIGGVLCGRCRGRGMISVFLDDETCPTCRGVGRLL